ncbi:XRE family transcriptional regulator [Clavibacter michiganensis]|uniref:helix-turn-helix domain-containing protein n=1 Tax=Clavibacter michiganensis TaxID=28447 RepID=UPI000CE82DD2|nr:helix-turn-helix transcriptional regulator [Clavibacter michiganensis]PPF90462.1 XRE family transcriptional regulator [Clavibacter michiganensis]PPF93064.1 XRE family transcriptional regulator [Clavibacter michiganensis]
MNETRIVDLRTQRGWTQERLAEASSITVRTVQRLEAGNDASLDTLTRVAKALEVQVRDLFSTVDESGYGRAVTALDTRAARQQERRDTITDGLEALYYGVGALLTIAVIVGITTDAFANHAIFLIPAYWIAGWLLALFLFLVVLSPRLDRRFPLSRDRREQTPDGRSRSGPSGGRPRAHC